MDTFEHADPPAEASAISDVQHDRSDVMSDSDHGECRDGYH